MSMSNEVPTVQFNLASSIPLSVTPITSEVHHMSRTYQVNEVFYSLQGEGIRVGTPNIFVRFSGCNMKCDLEPGPYSPGGFQCDTEFASGRKCSLDEIADWCAIVVEISLGCQGKSVYGDGLIGGYDFWQEPWLILTGGEPALQVDRPFCDYWHQRGVKLAIETNGTIELPYNLVGDGPSENVLVAKEKEKKAYLLDWITLSPKVAEHAVKQLWANELKYVRGYGQGIPKPAAKSIHHLLSPAFDGDRIDARTIQWCIRLCLENPQWRLSVQQHKTLWRMR